LRRLAARCCMAAVLAPLMFSFTYSSPEATAAGTEVTAGTATEVASGAGIAVVTDVRYATADGVPLLLDVYRPTKGGPHPAVVAVHGGSWRGGDKTNWRLSAPVLARAGMVVFSVNYRLSPPSGNAEVGDAVDDVTKAVRWVRRNGLNYGADADNVALLGSSAGAHLSLIVGQNVGSLIVRAVAAWSPTVDLAALAFGPLRGKIRGFIGCSVQVCPDWYKRMSPLKRVTSFDPPTFLANSTHEVIPRKQLRKMDRRLDKAGVVNAHAVFPGTAHGLALRTVVLEETIAWLKDPSAIGKSRLSSVSFGY
jgi:acetyl esterase